MNVILERQPDATAVFCGSDLLAVGALKECRRRGLRVPQDLSLVGFDNLEISEFLSPALTTVSIPAAQMGIRAANFLLGTPEERRLSSRVELETQLIVRGTTAPPPRRHR